jgi:hypothetical protein
MSVEPHCCIMLLKFSSTLMSCLAVLSSIKHGVLKSPTIIVEMPISPFSSVNFCLTFFIFFYWRYWGFSSGPDYLLGMTSTT